MSSTFPHFALVLACALSACSGERASPPRGATDAAPELATADAPIPNAPLARPPGAQESAQVPGPPGSFVGPARESAMSGAPRAATRQDVIVLEGFSEPFTFTLYETPAAFPLGFSTYVPADMLATGDGSSVTFVANFAGRRNDRVFLKLLPRPWGEDDGAARAAMDGLVRSRGTHRIAGGPNRFQWSIAEAPYTRKGASGLVALGRHGGRYFIVLTEYPFEYADGFGPRVSHILQDLRWSDGSRLRAE